MDVSSKILVIDDDPGLLTLLKLGLERDGFAVTTAANGKEGLRKAYETHPDAIILDIMMAEMNGWDTCQRLRHVCDTPIIMLTAKSGGQDVVKGLSLGADDYVSKPCSLSELKARIHTVLRRSDRRGAGARPDIYADDRLEIDLRTGVVKKHGAVVELTPTESRLLMYLVSRRGRIVPHKELLVNVWGTEYADEIKYLSVYIRYLRQKVEDDASDPHYIRTRWKVGYYFVGDDVPM
jgi:two-component system KDP operon response regulator KdpE